MPKSQFYAVRKGRMPGIYDSWANAESQVAGYSGASFKGFNSRDDAEIFMRAQTADCKLARFYAVAVGRHPGIYETWAEAASQIRGFPDAVHKRFNDRNSASQFLIDYAESHNTDLAVAESSAVNEVRMRRSRSRSRQTNYSSQSAVSSIISASSRTCCFVEDALLKTDIDTFRKASALAVRDIVLDRNDERVEVQQAQVHRGRHSLVELHVRQGDATEVHVFTASHRVVVCKGDDEEEKLARDVNIDDILLSHDNHPMTVESIHQFKPEEEFNVVELRFSGDAAVVSQPPARGLITRGQQHGPLRLRASPERAQSESPRAHPRNDTESIGYSRGTHPNLDECLGICWSYHRNGRCSAGVDCMLCHAPHRELPRRIRSNRGSGSHVTSARNT